MQLTFIHNNKLQNDVESNVLKIWEYYIFLRTLNFIFKPKRHST